MREKIRQAEIIIEKAISIYKPKRFVLMVSGGHDSFTNAHVSANILKSKGIDFVVYHGDTTIGIPETQQFVIKTCELLNWKLIIRKPPNIHDHYENIVERFGFPGSTKSSHQLMFRRLKERALRNFVTHECKSKPHSRENIALLSGVRQQESKIRMGYKHVCSKEDSRVWVNPIFFWTEDDCSNYMIKYNIPFNPVKQTIGISGECLCGAFANQNEYDLIKKHYPGTAAVIDSLHEKAKMNGFDWPWWSGPTARTKKENKNIQCKVNYMCVSCGLNN